MLIIRYLNLVLHEYLNDVNVDYFIFSSNNRMLMATIYQLFMLSIIRVTGWSFSVQWHIFASFNCILDVVALKCCQMISIFNHKIVNFYQSAIVCIYQRVMFKWLLNGYGLFGASELTMNDMGKVDRFETMAKHNQATTACIILGI